jgi:hypothetical protein
MLQGGTDKRLNFRMRHLRFAKSLQRAEDSLGIP